MTETMNKRASFSWIFLGAWALLLTSCATMETAENKEGKKDETPAVASNEKPAAAHPSKSSKASQEQSAEEIENLTIEEVIRVEEPNTASLYDNSRYDFPITMNSKVEGWIDYFTGRGRSHMERYLERGSRYMPVMRELLKKNGLPEDLVYLALIESGFNLRARSRARAVGAWQFMKPTGKRYGLRVDSWVDERRDPLRATEAAARYLKDLYLMFESWYLAASAYNAGEYKILRAIGTVKTHNYWRIAQTSTIRRETKDYVPKLIAAAIIAKNPDKYGFGNIEYDEPLRFETVTVDFPINLKDVASLIDISDDDVYDLNPELIQNTVPPNSLPYDIRVPVGSKVVLDRAIASLRNKGPELASLPYEHVVKAGETAKSIARRYRVQVNELLNANNLSPKEKLTPGSAIVIPRKNAASTPVKTVPTKRNVGSLPSPTAPQGDGDFVTHTVKRGESLWSISEQYDVTIQDLFKWNNLKKSNIFPGKKLKVKTAAKETTGAAYSQSKRRTRRG